MSPKPIGGVYVVDVYPVNNFNGKFHICRIASICFHDRVPRAMCM